jgi:hypothetical protein
VCPHPHLGASSTSSMTPWILHDQCRETNADYAYAIEVHT